MKYSKLNALLAVAFKQIAGVFFGRYRSLGAKGKRASIKLTIRKDKQRH